MTGVVREFDEKRGIGVVIGDDGVEYPFHCTRILDGTRRVPVGAAVEFEIAAGGQGRWEAVAIHAMMEPRSSSSA